jgi:phosphatidylinositol alpha-1,6-mannosyltransferase
VRSRPALAAITLNRRGGGVAAVSRLLQQVVAGEWGRDCRVVTLVRPGADSLETGPQRRIRFGARLTWLQASGQCDWMLCTHLSVARAQDLIPAPVRRPYAVFLHGIEAWRPLTPSQQRALQGATVLLANSAYTSARVVAAHAWLPAPAICPLTLPPLEAGEASPGVAPKQIWGPHAVLLVGRLASAEQYKGHDQLIDAWPAVLASVPDARLVFVGDGDDVPRLRAKAQALGVASSLVTTGFLEDRIVRLAYRDAAVFAMPSRNEGFGLVYLEAMAAGLPCIGSTEDAAGEIIEDGKSGFLVEQGNPADLANRLVALLRDPARRREMGDRGRALLDQRFSYAQFRDRVITALSTAFDVRERASSRVESRLTS